MEKPVFKEGSFSVDDIHKLREYHYEMTKNMTVEERVKEINDRARKFEEKMEARKVKKAIV